MSRKCIKKESLKNASTGGKKAFVRNAAVREFANTVGRNHDAKSVVVLKFASTGAINNFARSAADRLFASTGGKNKHANIVVVLKFASTGGKNNNAKIVVDRLFVSKTIVRKPLLKSTGAIV